MENPYEAPSAQVEDVDEADGGWSRQGEYASRVDRLGAKILDNVLVAIPSAAIMIPEETGSSAAFIPILALLGLLALLVVIAGNLYLVHQNGQTIGKKVVGIKIVRADRRTDAGFWRIVIRRFGSTMVMSVVSLVSLIDVLFIFSETRQCLHDRMADTTVVDVETAKSEEDARTGESRSEFDEELSYETPDVEW